MGIAIAVIAVALALLVGLIARDIKRHPNRDWNAEDDQWSDIEGW